jgi:signal peptidase II
VCFVPRQRLRPHLNYTVLVVALLVSAVDEVTKAWARRALGAHDVHVAGVMWLRLRFNSGISFSINQSAAPLTTIVTVVIALAVLVVGLNAASGVSAAGFGLLIGGGVANVIDRLAASPHRVTDFISLGSFPVFNLADVCITAGFIVLMIAALRGEKLVRR